MRFSLEQVDQIIEFVNNDEMLYNVKHRKFRATQSFRAQCACIGRIHVRISNFFFDERALVCHYFNTFQANILRPHCQCIWFAHFNSVRFSFIG